VELPIWGQLDAGCAWREFAAGAAAPAVAHAVARFAPQAVLGVDWHSLAAYDALAAALAGTAAGALAASDAAAATAAAPALAPFIFMNYRVHLRTAAGEDAALLARLERAALERSACTTVLSRSDAQYLSEAFPDVAPYKALHVSHLHLAGRACLCGILLTKEPASWVVYTLQGGRACVAFNLKRSPPPGLVSR
jgi:hypothetical protein